MAELKAGRVGTPSSSLDLDEEAQRNVVQQVFDLWITPEIARRKTEGRWADGTALVGAQVFLPSPLDGEVPTVLLNQEVRAIAKVKFKDAAHLKPGDPVRANDIKEIGSIRRLPEDHPNAGMITILSLNDKWHMVFDLRRDAHRAKRILDAAQDFALSARDSDRCDRRGPAFDNLYSAAELSAKAQLLLFAFYPYNNPKDHGAIYGRHKKWVQMGNLPSSHSQAFDKLRRARSNARYLDGYQPLPGFDLLFWAVAEMIATGRGQLPEFNDETEEVR